MGRRAINRNRQTSLLLASACVISLAGGMPAAAAGADESTATVDVVVVTARKREEDIQKVPIAITALQAAQLNEGKLDEVNEIMRLVPNVSFKNDQFTSSDISIRGSSRNLNAEEPGVGVYRDGVYVGGMLTNTSNFYDLERVEVLRGPQAGLYGRNAVGGAVNFITAKPQFDGVEGYVNAQYGSHERAELRGAVNIPVVQDKLAVRLSGLLVDQDKGFWHIDNLDQYADAYRNTSARARVRWAPTENLESLTTIEYYETKGPATFVLRNPFVTPGINPEDLDDLQVNVRPRSHGDQTQFIEELNYNTDYGTLTGLYGYRTTSADSSLDNDSSIVDSDNVINDAEQKAHYADLRFSSRDFGGFRFVAGATYVNDKTDLNQEYKAGGLFGTNLAQWFTTGQVTANPFGIPVGAPITMFGLTPLGNSGGWSGANGDSFPVASINEQRLKSYALYLEANYRLNDAWEIWGNIRYTHDTKKLHFTQGFGNREFACPIACTQVFKAFVTDGLDPAAAVEASHTFKNVSPGVGVNYSVNSHAQIYGKVVTGFKAGGFNDLASMADLLPFDPEKTISYELGVKSNWFDNRLQLNGDVFYQRRKDALVEVPDPLFASIGVTLGVNAGLIENKGVEFDVRAVPIPGLDISLSGGYLDSTFKEFVSGGVDYSGNLVPTTYRWSLATTVSYNWPLTSQWDGFAFASYSNRWHGYTNNDNARASRSPEQLDVRLGAKSEHWNVIGFVDNLTDARYAPYEFYVPNVEHSGTISPGRTVGIEIDYQF